MSEIHSDISNINLYAEMNEKIVDILRLSTSDEAPQNLYAASLIEWQAERIELYNHILDYMLGKIIKCNHAPEVFCFKNIADESDCFSIWEFDFDGFIEDKKKRDASLERAIQKANEIERAEKELEEVQDD